MRQQVYIDISPNQRNAQNRTKLPQFILHNFHNKITTEMILI